MRTRQIPEEAWADPQQVLFARKGPVQDHALLLASVLLGAKRDAFVCKGMIKVKQKDQTHLVEHEHAWVMVRHEKGGVTFWEPCTREIYHLPKRHQEYSKDNKDDLAANKEEAPKEEDEEEGDDLQDETELADLDERVEALANEIPDVRLTSEEIDILPTVGRMPRPKAKTRAAGPNEREKQMREQLKKRQTLPFAPKTNAFPGGPDLITGEGVFVDWLPYDSIEVVFNMDNLWRNVQNHHPACITYNLQNKEEWVPFLSPDEKNDDKKYNYEPLTSEVIIEPEVRNEVIDDKEKEVVAEMEENMSLYRGKHGRETVLDKSTRLTEKLDEFLEMMEKMRRLDIDLCPWVTKEEEDDDDTEPKTDLRPPWKEDRGDDEASREEFLMDYVLYLRSAGKCAHAKKYNKQGTVFDSKFFETYKQEQTAEWEQLKANLNKWEGKKDDNFPVQRGKVFEGHPYHFCTSEKEGIRQYLMEDDSYVKILEMEDDSLSFTTHCKMFPMLGAVQSTWIYIGWQRNKNAEDG